MSFFANARHTRLYCSGSHSDGAKGATWRNNYLARLKKVGYHTDEFTSDRTPVV
jgi:hypothetical protein